MNGACIALKQIKSLPGLQLGLLPRAAQVQTPAQQVPGLANSDSTSRQESSPPGQCLQTGSRAAGPARGTKLPWAMSCHLLQELRDRGEEEATAGDVLSSLSPSFVTGSSEVSCSLPALACPRWHQGTGHGERAAVPTSQCRCWSQPWHVAAEALARGHFSAAGGMLTLRCSVAFQSVTLFMCHVNQITVSFALIASSSCNGSDTAEQEAG